MKRTFSTELAYVFGIVFVAWGVVLMEKADFGVSMVVAPAYLLYRWLSPVWSFVTFGMAEYCLQAVLLLAMCLLLRRFLHPVYHYCCRTLQAALLLQVTKPLLLSFFSS